MKYLKQTRPSSVALFAFVLSTIFLWPIRKVSPIADDLHLISQGSGIMRQSGLLHVMDIWSDFSLSSAHLTPLGGIWTAIYVWVTNQLALHTPLTLATAWGVLRVLSIVIAIQSALHLGRTICQVLHLTNVFNFVLPLVLLSTIQVHGYWSNDPVVSFPVASWTICIIGFLFFSFFIRSLNSQIWSSRVNYLMTGVLAIIGIFTYELFLTFLVAGFLLLSGQSIISRKLSRNQVLLFFTTVFIPSSVLVLSQIIRLTGGSSYSGTEISVGSTSLPKIFLIALLSSLPLANLKLTHELIVQNHLNFLQYFLSIAVLLVLSVLIIWLLNLHRSNERSSKISTIVIALGSIWFVATAMIVATPKYQSELNGVFGKVYVNYAPSWIALSLIISILTVRTFNSKKHLFGIFIVALFPISGIWQIAANLKQLSTLTTDTQWSQSLFTHLESPISENIQRCQQFDRLFGLPLPEYYQTEIFEGLQNSYSGTYGVPYCDYDALAERSPLTLRSIAGLYPAEFILGGKNFYWSNSDFVSFDLTYRGSSPFVGELEIAMGPTPCPSSHSSEVKIGNYSPIEISVSESSDTAKAKISLNPNQTVHVEIHQSGGPCSISNDPRSFMPLLEFPRLVSSKS